MEFENETFFTTRDRSSTGILVKMRKKKEISKVSHFFPKITRCIRELVNQQVSRLKSSVLLENFFFFFRYLKTK